MNIQNPGKKFLFKLLASVLLWNALLLFSLSQLVLSIVMIPDVILLGVILLLVSHLIFAFFVSVRYFSDGKVVKALGVAVIVLAVDILLVIVLGKQSLQRWFGVVW